MAKRRTQAVVVIHGIGEQLPMGTLRPFVEAVLPPSPHGGPRYFSKPDSLSESFELRKLQDRDQPRTHFYEYYWAHKVGGTTFRHVLSWLRSLLIRSPGQVPDHLRLLWWATWVLALAALVCWILYGFDKDASAVESLPLLAAVFMTLVLALLQGLVLRYVGDAARYLSPHPSNISLRQSIRSDGIGLLRRLHEEKKVDGTAEYDRIVLVGHSLGSVIAYDIIKHFWQETNRVYELPANHDQAALRRLEGVGEDLRDDPNDENLEAYRKAQTELWWELRDLGNPWIVTDLVTLGSPLAHATLLLARDADDLGERQSQRELPTCPPVPETADDGCKRYSYRVWEPYLDADGEEHTMWALHHAGPFAVTRWTNLYFRTRFAVFGDLVGGKLAKWFGRGVRDRMVKVDSWIRSNTPLAHTSYWPRRRTRGGLALDELIAALDRNGVRTFRDLVEPTS